MPRPGLDPAAYSDRAAFDRERDAVFAGNWIPVCRMEDVADVGDFVTYDLAGDPIIVVRTTDGLRAVSNVCRHRNAVMLDGAGNIDAIRCPYHLWSYELDGTLTGVSSPAGLPDLDRSTMCLPTYGVAHWLGFVLVNTDADAEPPDTELAPLAELIAPYDVESMVRVTTVEWQHEFNWKVFVENFLESYHHPGVHPETLEARYLGRRSFVRTQLDDDWVALDHVSVDPDNEPLLVLGVFPLFMFAVSRPDTVAWAQLEVIDEQHFTLRFHGLLWPSEAEKDGAAELEKMVLTVVNNEDEFINKRVQRGLNSRHATVGVIHELEAGLAQFHRWYTDRI